MAKNTKQNNVNTAPAVQPVTTEQPEQPDVVVYNPNSIINAVNTAVQDHAKKQKGQRGRVPVVSADADTAELIAALKFTNRVTVSELAPNISLLGANDKGSLLAILGMLRFTSDASDYSVTPASDTSATVVRIAQTVRPVRTSTHTTKGELIGPKLYTLGSFTREIRSTSDAYRFAMVVALNALLDKAKLTPEQVNAVFSSEHGFSDLVNFTRNLASQTPHAYATKQGETRKVYSTSIMSGETLKVSDIKAGTA